MKYTCKKYARDALTANEILKDHCAGETWQSWVFHHGKRRTVVYGLHKQKRKLVFVIVSDQGTTDKSTIKIYSGRIRTKAQHEYETTKQGKNCQLFT